MPTARSPSAPGWLLPFGIALSVAVAGWWSTWFLCDDAFITFRFIGNARDGHGFVWNAAPFHPVEGYTSFLWMVVLWAVWSATGVPPPQAANPLALTCALLTLLLVARRLAAFAPPHAARWRPWATSLALLGVAGNHTFVTWASSGLETAMFGLWAVAWTLAATAARQPWRTADLARLALLAAMAALSRPDGVLLVLGTLAIALQRALRRELPPGAVLRGLLPLVLPIVHVAWRRAYYGEWLPNTYYAKLTTAWPESGLRYLYCFAVEQGGWFLAPLVLVWAAVAAVRRGALASLAGPRFPAAVAVGVWCGYVGYYTFVVGGDHFAYRVFAHLVPLLLLGSVAMLWQLRAPGGLAVAWLALYVVAGVVPGWWLERAVVGREAHGFLRTSQLLPAIGPLLERYDRCQAWLLVHSVGFRRALHAASCARALQALPERAAGLVAGAAPGQRLVYRADAVGVTGWALRDVAIIDGHGLCDRVIARNQAALSTPPIDAAVVRSAFPGFDGDGDGRLDARELAAATPMLASIGPQLLPEIWVEVLLALSDRDGDGRLDPAEIADAVQQMLPPRQMAHEREPPAGYIEALRCNVASEAGVLRVLPGVVPLTDAEVRAVEQAFFAQVRR